MQSVAVKIVSPVVYTPETLLWYTDTVFIHHPNKKGESIHEKQKNFPMPPSAPAVRPGSAVRRPTRPSPAA